MGELTYAALYKVVAVDWWNSKGSPVKICCFSALELQTRFYIREYRVTSLLERLKRIADPRFRRNIDFRY